LKEHGVARVPVGEAAANHVAGRQVDEDEADEHTPDVEAGPEIRREKAGSPELDPE
jgi:hypothetical protein